LHTAAVPVMAPGSTGGPGWVLIVTIVPAETQPHEISVALIVTIVTAEIHPLASFEVTVYVPASTRVNIPVVLVYVKLSML